MTTPAPKLPPSPLRPQEVVRNPGFGPILIPLVLAAWVAGGFLGILVFGR